MEIAPHLRQAVAALRRSPLSSLAVVFTLAAGIAGNMAVFTLVSATLLRPLPYAHGRDLVLLDAVRVAERTSNSFTLTRYEMLRDQARAFSAVAVATNDTLGLAGASLVVPPPSAAIIERIRSVLGPHNEAEERPDGLYAVCDELLAREAASLLARVRAFPAVPLNPHQGGPNVYRHIEETVELARREWAAFAASGR
jgi:hypothetical protein